MTETFCKTEFYEVDRTTFGGLIYPSDYNTDYRGKDNTRGSVIAQRIISDRNFDYRCKRNIELRSNNKKSGGSQNA